MSDLRVALSASRIKTAQTCSWLYYCRYILGLPDKGNAGSSRGSICHLVFEVLGNTRHHKTYKKVMSAGDIFAVKSIERLVMKHARKLGVDDIENIELIKEMIHNGLSYDFYGETIGKPTESLSEQDFDIVCDNGEHKYRIKGFIDKLFLYKKKKFALIRDFKSSKAVFKGKEVTDNLQDLMYSLAVKKLFPHYSNRQSEFLFLKFDLEDLDSSGVIRMTSVSDEELKGFEAQLSETQKYLENFSEKDATSNFALNQGYPKDGTFGGKLVCGLGSHKGELKKDGTKKWHCPFRFDFFYYKIKNNKGDVVQSVMEEDFDEANIPEGHTFEMCYYGGCSAFSK
jgi:hypothetical protein